MNEHYTKYQSRNAVTAITASIALWCCGSFRTARCGFEAMLGKMWMYSCRSATPYRTASRFAMPHCNKNIKRLPQCIVLGQNFISIHSYAAILTVYNILADTRWIVVVGWKMVITILTGGKIRKQQQKLNQEVRNTFGRVFSSVRKWKRFFESHPMRDEVHFDVFRHRHFRIRVSGIFGPINHPVTLTNLVHFLDRAL
jgi:hypothetical protein